MMCILAIIVATVTMIGSHLLPFLLQDKQYFLSEEELFLRLVTVLHSFSFVNLLTMCLYKNRKKKIHRTGECDRSYLVGDSVLFRGLRPGLVEDVAEEDIKRADFCVLKL